MRISPFCLSLSTWLSGWNAAVPRLLVQSNAIIYYSTVPSMWIFLHLTTASVHYEHFFSFTYLELDWNCWENKTLMWVIVFFSHFDAGLEAGQVQEPAKDLYWFWRVSLYLASVSVDFVSTVNNHIWCNWWRRGENQRRFHEFRNFPNCTVFTTAFARSSCSPIHPM